MKKNKRTPGKRPNLLQIHTLFRIFILLFILPVWYNKPQKGCSAGLYAFVCPLARRRSGASAVCPPPAQPWRGRKAAARVCVLSSAPWPGDVQEPARFARRQRSLGGEERLQRGSVCLRLLSGPATFRSLRGLPAASAVLAGKKGCSAGLLAFGYSLARRRSGACAVCPPQA